MLTYKDIVQGNGFLTDKGLKLVNETFLPTIKEMLSVMQSENEIRVMASILSNLIGKAAADLIQEKHDETEDFNEMSDAEFFDHLKSKYDHFDLLTSPLTSSEMRRVQSYWQKKFGISVEKKVKDSSSHMIDPFDSGASSEAYNKLMSATNDAVMDILEKTKKKIASINKSDTTNLLDEFLNHQISDKSKTE